MAKRDFSERFAHLADTDRLEAFSDGVFSIIITLLVLEIRRPAAGSGHLLQDLMQNWTSYVAYAVAFLYVGIIWLNHHNLFHLIGKVDLPLCCVNLLGLGVTALMPFPTGVMAEAFRTGDFSDQKAAVVVYAVVVGLMSASWLPLFIHLSRHPELMKPSVKTENFGMEVSRPIVGVVSYTLAAVLGWLFHPLWAIGIFVFMIIYHGATCQGVGRRAYKAD